VVVLGHFPDDDDDIAKARKAAELAKLRAEAAEAANRSKKRARCARSWSGQYILFFSREFYLLTSNKRRHTESCVPTKLFSGAAQGSLV
jgi:hypothetical protein